MSADNWVHIGYWVSANNTTSLARVLSLLIARVYSLQPMETLLKLWAETSVCCGLVCEERIATRNRSVKQIEECGAWWLLLVRHIRVPSYTICPLLEEVLPRGIVRTSVYEMDFWVALWCTRCGMDMVSAKVCTVIKSILDVQVRKVLVTERNNLSLRNEQCKLVLASLCELR
jgi:hypothetical protein